jgi:uncharacterized protein involved in exopolysaccharide biosynthesis
MTVPMREENDAASLLALGTLLLRRRARIARFMLAFGVLTVAVVAFKPRLYPAAASFVPQGSDPARSGLATLAGQFGIAVPSANPAQSPEFYQRILKSRVLLQRIARDTLVVPELGGRRIAFVDLFDIPKGLPARREEQGEELLFKLVETSVVKTTSVVEVSVATEWPSVSLAIVASLVDGVNEFNQRTRRLQASAERAFIEGRLALAAADQRESEDRLEAFLKSNRNFAGSPELLFLHDRLQRQVALRQQVSNALAQFYEEVRLREVRDTPVITVLEPPAVSTLPKPRHRVLITLFGVMFGAFAGGVTVFASEMMVRLRKEGNAAADELVRTVSEVRDDLLSPIRRLGQRGRSKEPA